MSVVKIVRTVRRTLRSTSSNRKNNPFLIPPFAVSHLFDAAATLFDKFFIVNDKKEVLQSYGKGVHLPS